MRDPKRIDKVLEEIKAVWIKVPDMRLGQILVNAISLYKENKADMFNIEDEVLIDAIRHIDILLGTENK